MSKVAELLKKVIGSLGFNGSQQQLETPTPPVERRSTASSNVGVDGLSLVKQICTRANGLRDFVNRATKEGFYHYENVPGGLGVVLKKDTWKISVGSWPGFGPDTIWVLIFRDDATGEQVFLINEGMRTF